MRTKFKPRKKSGMFPYEESVYKGRPKRRGVKYAYEASTLPYTITRTYFPDFTVTLPNGSVFYIEVKGWFRPEDKAKLRAVLDTNPGIDLRMVFPKTNKRDIAWCVRNKVPYAIGAIPSEWLDDEVKGD